MASTFSIFNNLCSTYWKPIDFNIIGDQFSTKKQSILCNNGMFFYLHNFLKNSTDFTFNKKTGTFLTSMFYNSYFVTNKENPKDVEKLEKIESPIKTLDGYYLSIFNANSAIPNNPNILIKSDRVSADSSDVLTLFFEDDFIIIKNKIGNVLTISSDKLIFSKQILPYINNQKFNYILERNNIYIFKYDNLYNKIALINSSNILMLSSISLTENQNLPLNSFFKLGSYRYNDEEFLDSVSNSFLVKYKTNPIYSENKLEINKEFSDENLCSQNYLGMYPVENPTVNESDCAYDFQIHGLKNYQTPEYEYSTSNPKFSDSPSIRRVYNKIFTGTNQNKGYDKIFLGFHANTKKIDFKVDQDTKFYFPATSSRIPLSSCGLIEDGAVAGEVPYASDRIYLYKTNYEELIPDAPQPLSITKFDNTWLCSWLSGTNLGDKIWLDRYYNSAFYTLDEALTAKSLLYHPKLSANEPLTFDTPSTMYMEPGALYTYSRYGINGSKEFLKYLNYDINDPKGANVLTITNWLSSPILDDSLHKNNGLAFFSDDNTFKGNYITLNGNNHVVFPSKTSLLQKNKFTVSMWVNVDDWGNISGDQIFGNYYDSGFGLINEGFLSSPLVTIVNQTSSISYNFNYKFNKLSQNPLNGIYNSNFSFIQRTPDYNYWIFDSNNIIGHKYDSINNLVYTIPSGYLSLDTIDQLEMDSNQNMYLYDNSLKKYVIIDQNGSIQSTHIITDSSVNGIQLDSNNNVIEIYGNSSIIDGNNNIWEAVGGNLYKNRQVYANVGFVQQISCDSKNNIWISHEQDRISKLNTEKGIFEFSFRIGKNSGSPLNLCFSQNTFRFLNFIRIPLDNNRCNKNTFYNDVLILIDNRDNEAYLIDEVGNLLSKLDLRALLDKNTSDFKFYAKGDFTGYQFLRKYGAAIKNVSWKFKISEPNGKTPQLFSLNYNSESLPIGWHMFTFTFDSTQGYAKYFIDSIEVDSAYFDSGKYQLNYEYRSSLLLGAATIKNTTLNDIIGIDNTNKFIGSISDLRIYSKSLTIGETEQLYFSSEFSSNREDLSWNVLVGDRNYIEEIQYWYKNQLPGNKSKYFNINIHNLNIKDDLKFLIEESIKNNIKKLTPAESSLYKINWL